MERSSTLLSQPGHSVGLCVSVFVVAWKCTILLIEESCALAITPILDADGRG